MRHSLDVLVTVLHLQGVAADAEQIGHRLEADKIGAPEMLRCAKTLDSKPVPVEPIGRGSPAPLCQ